jgi:hypothetical protein
VFDESAEDFNEFGDEICPAETEEDRDGRAEDEDDEDDDDDDDEEDDEEEDDKANALGSVGDAYTEHFNEWLEQVTTSQCDQTFWT